MFRSVFSLFAILSSLLGATCFAKGDIDLFTLNSGDHSFRQLGEDFFIEVPLKKIQGARLLLFNYQLCERLNLKIPADPQELEKVILDQFAVQVENAKTASTFRMATYYQDSQDTDEGSARGDGRAVWTGELVLPKKDGSLLYVDVVVKGIGATPLAWSKHTDPGHKDGLQSLRESIHSFIMSEANYRNQLDSTVDLAVIELPIMKEDQKKQTQDKATITIRLGNQTRIAHYRYFQYKPDLFEKIFEYSVRRDLGLPFDAPVDSENVKTYLTRLAENLGNESAGYYDLHAFHGSLTSGNRTTKGSTIDMGTWKYFDSSHDNSVYVYYSDESKRSQEELMKDYLDDIRKYMTQAHYHLLPSTTFFDELNSLFDQTFRDRLTQHWLIRLGFTEKEGTELMKVPAAVEAFFSATWELFHSIGLNPVYTLGCPAQLDMRLVFQNSIRVMADSDLDDLSPKERTQIIAAQLLPKRGWSLFPQASQRFQTVGNYHKAVMALLNILTHDQPTSEVDHKLIQWIERSQWIHKNSRPDCSHEKEACFRALVDVVYEAAKQGTPPQSFEKLSHLALKMVSDIVDSGLLPRNSRNLDVIREE